jgi:hypothetical protein
MTALADLSSECHQSIKVRSNQLQTNKLFDQINVFLVSSTIASTPLLSLTASHFLGGTTKTETTNSSGPAQTRTSTLVSAASMEIASNLSPSATAIPLHRSN